MTDAAADLWTGFVATWPIWLFIATLSVVAGLLLWSEERDRRIQAARAKFAAEALTLASSGGIPPCGTTRDDLTCNRPQGHPGVHVDATKGREIGWARWTGGAA